MTAPRSSTYKGFWVDNENGTLDVYYGSGGASDPVEVARFNATSITLLQNVTQSSGNLTLNDDLLLGIGTGNTARFSWDTTDANANELLLQMPAGGAVDVPVLAVGQSIESVDLGLFNGIVDPTVALFGVGAVTTGTALRAYKARGTIASPTAITTGDDLFTLSAYGYSGAGGYVEAARIQLDSTGTIATTRVGGVISLQVGTDASPTVLTERVQITGSGQIVFTPATDIQVANGTGVIVGHTAQVTLTGVVDNPEVQVLGTGATDSAMLTGQWSAGGDGPRYFLAKSRNATIGSFTIVQNNDTLGEIIWTGDDGVDYGSIGAIIRVSVDGTPGAADMPSRMLFMTTADGAETPNERMRIASTGLITIAAGTTPASVAGATGTNHAGSLTASGGLGGNTSIASTGTGGNGGGFSFTGGNGGTAASATTASTGGNGGAFTVSTGAGAVGTASGSSNGTGGNGGAISLTTGAGGAVTTNTGTNLGGTGGAVTVTTGNGGAAQDGTDTGGASGAISLITGTGGAGDTGGASGSITLRTGAVGAGGSPTVGSIIFQVSGANTQWTISGANGNLLGEAGNIIQSNASGEIAFCVTNETLTVGAEGSMILPYRSSTDAAFDDTAGGNLDGAIGIQYDSDTGPTSTIEVRSNGAWVSVAVSGYLMQSKVEFNPKLTNTLHHAKQVYMADDRWWIDESKCFVCGEDMQPGEQSTFWGNYNRPDGSLHNVFGHLHVEKDAYVQGLEQRVVDLENKLARRGSRDLVAA